VVVERLGGVDAVVRANGDAEHLPELAAAGSVAAADAGQIGIVVGEVVEDVDDGVPRIGDVEPALAIHGQVVRPPIAEAIELSAGRARDADRAHVVSVAVEDLDAVVARIGDVDVAVPVYSDIEGAVEVGIVRAGNSGLPQRGQIGELIAVNLYAVIISIGNIDLAGMVNGDAMRSDELVVAAAVAAEAAVVTAIGLKICRRWLLPGAYRALPQASTV
jgi:hypothetical protein